jgi:hypothetical protein
MTRLEKCIKAKELGYTYDPESGIVYGLTGRPIKSMNNGYLEISGQKQNRLRLLAHTFAWFSFYGNIDVDKIDHINRNKTDNRICNLRNLTNQQNAFNTPAKGYYLCKTTNKWRAQIVLNQKHICLGRYNTEEEARNAYLKGKEKYHII